MTSGRPARPATAAGAVEEAFRRLTPEERAMVECLGDQLLTLLAAQAGGDGGPRPRKKKAAKPTAKRKAAGSAAKKKASPPLAPAAGPPPARKRGAGAKTRAKRPGRKTG